jgi:hypothetical protein
MSRPKEYSDMKITEYINQYHLQPVIHSDVKPIAIPSLLAHKFDLADEVEYYSSPDESRWVGICRARNFFAAAKPGVAITIGNLDDVYPTLRSF